MLLSLRSSSPLQPSSVVRSHLNLVEVGLEVSEANVLSHLNGADGVELLSVRNISVIGDDEVDASLSGSGLLGLVVVGTPLGAFLAQSDTGGAGLELPVGVAHEGSPTAANVEHAVALLEPDLLADLPHFVVLGALEGVILRLENCTCVDHPWAEEGVEEVVSPVVVVGNLPLGRLLILQTARGQRRGAKRAWGRLLVM